MSNGNGEVHQQLAQGLEKKANRDETPLGSNKRVKCKLTSSPKNCTENAGNLKGTYKSPERKDDGVDPMSCSHSAENQEVEEINGVYYWAYKPISKVSL